MTGGAEAREKRRMAQKRFRAKLKEITDWLRRERNRLKTGELLRQAESRLVGRLNYYSIIDNGPRCHSFRRQFRGLLRKWLN